MGMTIKEARTKAGLTQKEMAEMFGIPKRTIENWEEGKSRPAEWAASLLIAKLQEMSEHM